MNTYTGRRKKTGNIQIAAAAVLIAAGGMILAKYLWTDENTHDPGNTILEGLDYSINDLEWELQRRPEERSGKRD